MTPPSNVAHPVLSIQCPLSWPPALQWFLEQHRMELGTDPDVRTAARLAQQMAYQNKDLLQVGAAGKCRGGSGAGLVWWDGGWVYWVSVVGW